MAYKKLLKERGTNISIYPITRAECVLESNGTDINTHIDNAVNNLSTSINDRLNNLNNSMSQFDSELTSHRQNYNVGEKHLPTTETAGQILISGNYNTSKWENLSNVFPEIEQMLAYGVEWDITVSDPHLTRIGNISLHKTLPIQSQLKGCIAQGNKIIYWLNENNWNYRKEPVYANEPLFETMGTLRTTFNVASQPIGCFVGQKVRIFDNIMTPVDEGTISEITDGVAHITWNKGTFDAGGKVELGARLDGYDGTVRVYCPGFYIKSKIIGDKRQVWLSTVKIDDTWTYQPEILIDAYRSTVLNTVPENMGYLSTLPVNSAISVVNTATYCRGGKNDSTYDKYLTGEGNTTIDIFRTYLGKPRTRITRADMRTYSRNAGNEMLSYDQYKNIFYWLYVVEYANFNCQEAYNEELTYEGFRQGGLGAGVTTMEYVAFMKYGNDAVTPCGYGNEIGNGTGIKTINIPEIVIDSTTTLAAHTFDMPRWRGFDNPFGDIDTVLDGIIIDTDADNHENGMNYVYTCQDPSKYSDSLNENYKKVAEGFNNYAGAGSQIMSAYIKEFDLGDTAHIIGKVLGVEDPTTFKCDASYTFDRSNTPKIPRVGGYMTSTSTAGLGYAHLSQKVNEAYGSFRSVSSSVSFPNK